MIRHALGCRADQGDQRDYQHQPPMAARLPAVVDLSAHLPPVMDRGSLGSCVLHASVAAYRYDLLSRGKPDFAGSRLFGYYNARALEGSVKSDSGVEIRDGLKAIAQCGLCPETDWPYDVKRFAVKPTPRCYPAGLAHQALVYERVPLTSQALLATLAGGLPVILGISVYESFESDAVAKTGIVPLPKRGEQLLGGHAVLADGYRLAASRVRCRNSWSAGWGQHGDFEIQLAYLTNPDLCSDAWVLRTVE